MAEQTKPQTVAQDRIKTFREQRGDEKDRLKEGGMRGKELRQTLRDFGRQWDSDKATAKIDSLKNAVQVATRGGRVSPQKSTKELKDTGKVPTASQTTNIPNDGMIDQQATSKAGVMPNTAETMQTPINNITANDAQIENRTQEVVETPQVTETQQTQVVAPSETSTSQVVPSPQDEVPQQQKHPMDVSHVENVPATGTQKNFVPGASEVLKSSMVLQPPPVIYKPEDIDKQDALKHFRRKRTNPFYKWRDSSGVSASDRDEAKIFGKYEQQTKDNINTTNAFNLAASNAYNTLYQNLLSKAKTEDEKAQINAQMAAIQDRFDTQAAQQDEQFNAMHQYRYDALNQQRENANRNYWLNWNKMSTKEDGGAYFKHVDPYTRQVIEGQFEFNPNSKEKQPALKFYTEQLGLNTEPLFAFLDNKAIDSMGEGSWRDLSPTMVDRLTKEYMIDNKLITPVDGKIDVFSVGEYNPAKVVNQNTTQGGTTNSGEQAKTPKQETVVGRPQLSPEDLTRQVSDVVNRSDVFNNATAPREAEMSRLIEDVNHRLSNSSMSNRMSFVDKAKEAQKTNMFTKSMVEIKDILDQNKIYKQWAEDAKARGDKASESKHETAIANNQERYNRLTKHLNSYKVGMHDEVMKLGKEVGSLRALLNGYSQPSFKDSEEAKEFIKNNKGVIEEKEKILQSTKDALRDFYKSVMYGLVDLTEQSRNYPQLGDIPAY